MTEIRYPAALKERWQRLTKAQKQAYWLRIDEGLTAGQIAARLGIEETAVWDRLRAGLPKLGLPKGVGPMEAARRLAVVLADGTSGKLEPYAPKLDAVRLDHIP